MYVAVSKRTDTPTLPIVAENPDHFRLSDKLDRVTQELKKAESDLAGEKSLRIAAERRETDLRSKLDSKKERDAHCEKVAKLSEEGRQLINKLFSTRADTNTRREIDRWYDDVCAAMSKPQCEAFLSAPRATTAWAGYPVDDGGYSQTLRGRSAFLSAQLENSCR